MPVTLDEVKLFLRIDGDEENVLITSFILASIEICEKILRQALSEFTSLPEVVRQAVFYSVAQFYENRETLDMKEMELTLTRLLSSLRQESW